MSTTGNEFEQPGVNRPDRGDADGATDTPRQGDSVRDDQPVMEGQTDDAGALGSGAAEDGHGGAMPAPQEGVASAPEDEASHVAVGIGVMDDGATPSAQAAGGHQGQDGGRDTMTASGAQKEGSLGAEQEQRLPAMSQNNANDIEKVSGIVVQTRNDIAGTEPDRVEEVLRQRLREAGIDLPDSDIRELARQITTGDA